MKHGCLLDEFQSLQGIHIDIYKVLRLKISLCKANKCIDSGFGVLGKIEKNPSDVPE